MKDTEKHSIINRINKYAEEALKDIDPQKTNISIQLEKLKPVMEQIATDYQMSLEEVFVLYMDTASETVAKQDQEMRMNLDF